MSQPAANHTDCEHMAVLAFFVCWVLCVIGYYIIKLLGVDMFLLIAALIDTCRLIGGTIIGICSSMF